MRHICPSGTCKRTKKDKKDIINKQEQPNFQRRVPRGILQAPKHVTQTHNLDDDCDSSLMRALEFVYDELSHKKGESDG